MPEYWCNIKIFLVFANNYAKNHFKKSFKRTSEINGDFETREPGKKFPFHDHEFEIDGEKFGDPNRDRTNN